MCDSGLDDLYCVVEWKLYRMNNDDFIHTAIFVVCFNIAINFVESNQRTTFGFLEYTSKATKLLLLLLFSFTCHSLTHTHTHIYTPTLDVVESYVKYSSHQTKTPSKCVISNEMFSLAP